MIYYIFLTKTLSMFQRMLLQGLVVSVALQLGCWPPVLKVWGLILDQVKEIVPLDYVLDSYLSIFIQKNKWIPTQVEVVNLQDDTFSEE